MQKKIDLLPVILHFFTPPTLRPAGPFCLKLFFKNLTFFKLNFVQELFPLLTTIR